MISEHASESDVQLYALTPDAVTATTAAHIEQCDHCRDTVASYQFIFGEIKEAPRPSFDFDHRVAPCRFGCGSVFLFWWPFHYMFSGKTWQNCSRAFPFLWFARWRPPPLLFLYSEFLRSTAGISVK